MNIMLIGIIISYGFHLKTFHNIKILGKKPMLQFSFYKNIINRIPLGFLDLFGLVECIKYAYQEVQ